MPLSNQIPSSRLIQPGVVESAATRPASPFEGQCIFQKDTDQLLVWNGTAWVIPNSPAQNPMGLELITTISLSGATTNFPGCFTSAYTNYRVVVDSPTISGAGEIYIRYLTGTTTPTSTASYYWSFRGFTTNSTSADIASAGNNYGFTGWESPGAGGAGGIVLDIFQPNLALTTIATVNTSYLGSGLYGTRNGQIAWDAGTVFTGFQFTSAGALTHTGKASVYGYRK